VNCGALPVPCSDSDSVPPGPWHWLRLPVGRPVTTDWSPVTGGQRPRSARRRLSLSLTVPPGPAPAGCHCPWRPGRRGAGLMSGRTEHIKQIQFYGSVSSVAQVFVDNIVNNCIFNQTEPTWSAHLVQWQIMKTLIGMSRVRVYIVIFLSRQLFWLSLCRAEWLLSSPNTVPQVRATSRAWANIRRKQSARIVRPSSRRSGGPRDKVKRLEKKKNSRTRCWGESTCFDRNASNNCDPHCLFLAPTVWMC